MPSAPHQAKPLSHCPKPVSLRGTAWGQDVHLLPAPEAIIALGESRLRQLGLGFRAPNLLAAAHDVADGRIDLAALRSMTYEDARGALLGLRGVGPKIADCVLAFSLDHTEAFAVDRWVSRAVIGRYLAGKRQPEERIAEWGRDRFRIPGRLRATAAVSAGKRGGHGCSTPAGQQAHSGAAVPSALIHLRIRAISSSRSFTSPSSRAERSCSR